MKYSLALSAIVASALAGAIPADVHQHIHRRAADPQPVCSFEEHTFDDSNAWDSITPATSKRDLGQTTWNPPSNLVTPLKQVWDHEISTYSDALGFQNYGYDQVMAAKGKINYCVRWEGSTKVTAAQRTQVETAIRKQFNKWIAILAGFEGWPYNTVDVNVVGWAVNDASILEGDVSNIDVYTDKDAGGVPQCAESCGRFFHQDGNYSGCKNGAARHYDQSLWLTPGFGGGAGGDWGQRVAQEYFMQNINSENIHIVLHEIGHTFALDDFYDWTPAGVTNFIMNAGSAMEITEFDAWMARDWWRNLKSNRGW
ncbi:Nn.00g041360.m01.CDS01 [Neocucurbitaria sp. VM-36]